VLAKNDPLDARMIASFVAIMPTRPAQPQEPAAERLAELLGVRRQLSAEKVAAENASRLSHRSKANDYQPSRALVPPHAREGTSPRTVFRAAPGAARRSIRNPNLTTSIPMSSVAATPVTIAQSNSDSGTVWNAVCRNGT
jgi:hypothetical protein